MDLKFPVTLAICGLFAAPVAALEPGAHDASPSVVAESVPAIDDPMLTEPPSARSSLQSWQQGISLLQAHTVQIRTARANVGQAQARVGAALAAMLPTVTANGNFDQHLVLSEQRVPGLGAVRFPTPGATASASLNLSVPVVAARQWFDHGTAQRRVDGERLSEQEAERLAVAGFADALVGELAAQRSAEVSRLSLKSALSMLELNRNRVALGLSTAIDVLRAEQEVSQSRAQILNADESLFEAREALGASLGLAETWSVSSDLNLDALVDHVEQSCVSERSVARRSDVRAAEVAVAVAERSVKSPDYGWAPSVSATSSATYWSASALSPNLLHGTWTVGAMLNWPLFDGNLRAAQKHEAEAELASAHAQADEIRRAATEQVNRAIRAVNVAEANLAVSRKTRDITAENAQLARTAFVTGTGTNFDLVDTAKNQRQAELDLALREFELLRTKIAALLALSHCKL